MTDGGEHLSEPNPFSIARQNIEDLFRLDGQPDDTPDMTASRRYLGARLLRLRAERSGQPPDVWPYRGLEVYRARRLSAMIGVTFENSDQRDEMLPTLARIRLEPTASNPQ